MLLRMLSRRYSGISIKRTHNKRDNSIRRTPFLFPRNMEHRNIEHRNMERKKWLQTNISRMVQPNDLKLGECDLSKTSCDMSDLHFDRSEALSW